MAEKCVIEVVEHMEKLNEIHEQVRTMRRALNEINYSRFSNETFAHLSEASNALSKVENILTQENHRCVAQAMKLEAKDERTT